jgi:hypothetical protein
MNKVKVIAEVKDFGTKDFPVFPEAPMDSPYHTMYDFKNPETGDAAVKHPYLEGVFGSALIPHNLPVMPEEEESDRLYFTLGLLTASGVIELDLEEADEIKLNELRERYLAIDSDDEEEGKIIRKETASIARKYFDLEIQK